MTPGPGELDEVSQFVMLTAHEGGRLFELLGDAVYPFREHDGERIRTECARAIRGLLERRWVELLREDRRASITATEPIQPDEVEAILSAPKFWVYESAIQQEFFVALDTTDAGEQALEKGVARSAFDRMYEQMDRGGAHSDPTEPR